MENTQVRNPMIDARQVNQIRASLKYVEYLPFVPTFEVLTEWVLLN